jgi:hypothetical protein
MLLWSEAVYFKGIAANVTGDGCKPQICKGGLPSNTMNLTSTVIGIVALIAALVALIPLLGWLNW